MLFVYSLEPQSRWSLLWMARAFRHAVEAGRLAHRAGRIPARRRAEPSSPQMGLVGS